MVLLVVVVVVGYFLVLVVDNIENLLLELFLFVVVFLHFFVHIFVLLHLEYLDYLLVLYIQELFLYYLLIDFYF
jgi:hypothetical protein